MNARVIGIGVKHLCGAVCDTGCRVESQWTGHGVVVVGTSPLTAKFLFSSPLGASIGKPNLQMVQQLLITVNTAFIKRLPRSLTQLWTDWFNLVLKFKQETHHSEHTANVNCFTTTSYTYYIMQKPTSFIGLYFALFNRIRQLCRPITSQWLKIDLYCLRNIVFHFGLKLIHPAARSLCDSWATCTIDVWIVWFHLENKRSMSPFARGRH